MGELSQEQINVDLFDECKRRGARIAELEAENKRLEAIIEELWKETKGVWFSTGAMWLTPRMEREAKSLAASWDAEALAGGKE
jgi:hypothetical protein